MENNFKGTKGKWEKVVDDKNYIIVRGGQIYKERPNFYSMKIIVGRIHDDDCGIPTCCRTEEHANALLISKAPEMLEMLKLWCMDMEERGKAYGDCYTMTKQLIKEATEL